MNNDSNNKITNADKVKGITHIVFGIIYIAFCGLVIYWNNIGNINLEPILAYAISGLMFAYGVFRIYRGYLRLKVSGKGW